ncbi:hypothetical protein VTK56DRAFT_6865 [Thermocarpiscus australiensis]
METGDDGSRNYGAAHVRNRWPLRSESLDAYRSEAARFQPKNTAMNDVPSGGTILRFATKEHPRFVALSVLFPTVHLPPPLVHSLYNTISDGSLITWMYILWFTHFLSVYHAAAARYRTGCARRPKFGGFWLVSSRLFIPYIFRWFGGSVVGTLDPKPVEVEEAKGK